MPEFFKSVFAISNQPPLVDTILLIIRILVGVAFIIHGYGKMQNPFGWLGPESPFPGYMQALSALTEIFCGLLLIAGLFTRFGALGILVDMLFAVYMHVVVWRHPVVSLRSEPSAEAALDNLALTLILLVLGPGRFALDRLLFGVR